MPGLLRSIWPVLCDFGTVTLTRAKFSLGERELLNTLASADGSRVVATKIEWLPAISVTGNRHGGGADEIRGVVVGHAAGAEQRHGKDQKLWIQHYVTISGHSACSWLQPSPTFR